MYKYTNALIHEASPYLQQHAHNPVHWFPWGEEAFARARLENKPIFLSIGYSTCHWCHVMEHESFEDEEVAAAMNDTFIAIKVDREERPDIDQVYMQVAQMMNGQGGWPLNILMTPDKKPFYAATYIPKYSRYQHIGMLDLAKRTQQLWASKRDEMEDSAEQITALLSSRSGVSDKHISLDGKALSKQAVQSLQDSFDNVHGGFGDAPKFPSPHKLLFLLRQAKQHGDSKSIAMVEKTLDAMRAGGVFDQIGFGFHRYATDGEWLLPHFEKMLYDQAMLMMAYTEAYQLTGHKRHAEVVREIATYVLRDMHDKTGGFYSAEDADSEGVEGKFYVWKAQQLVDILGEEDAHVAQSYFNFSEQGNFHDEATGKKTGENIPHIHVWQGDEDGKIQAIRKRLFDVREQRIRPFRDDKILTDWNGLMIAAFAKAGVALNEPMYGKVAQDCADFLLHTMRDKQGKLWHRYRHGNAAIEAHLDDYAFMVWGLIELYQSHYQAKYLQAALDLNQHMMQDFLAENGGLYLASADAKDLLIRPMDAWDGALPSGNAVAAENMVRLARLTADSTLEEKASRIFGAFSELITQAPVGFLHMLSALSLAEGDSMEIVFAGDKQGQDAQAMLDVLHAHYLPQAVSLWRDEQTQALIPFIRLQAPIKGKTTVYVCSNFQCNQPVTEIEAFTKLLQ